MKPRYKYSDFCRYRQDLHIIRTTLRPGARIRISLLLTIRAVSGFPPLRKQAFCGRRDSAARPSSACAIPWWGSPCKAWTAAVGPLSRRAVSGLPPLRKQAFCGRETKNSRSLSRPAALTFCGGGGIRTPGTLPPNSFQDCRHRPLGHTSVTDIPYWVGKFSKYPVLKQKNLSRCDPVIPPPQPLFMRVHLVDRQCESCDFAGIEMCALFVRKHTLSFTKV